MNEGHVDKALVKVILLTRDETDMIEDFLDYWGSIVDPPNVIVIDNGSTCPKVLGVYATHVARGGTVVYERRPFSEAVDFMTEHMIALADSGTCEWIFPIETDEFIFCTPPRLIHPGPPLPIEGGTPPPQESIEGGFNPPPQEDSSHGESTPLPFAEALASAVRPGNDYFGMPENVQNLGEDTVLRKAIFSHLRTDVPAEVGILKYGYFWGSSVDPRDSTYVRGAYARPAVDMVRFYDQGWDKLMVRASAFDGMLQWCHHASVKPGYLMAVTHRLGLLHFHDTGKRRAVTRAIPVVEGYRMVDLHHRTLSEKLDGTGRIRHFKELTCGHKLAYLDDHLRRQSTLMAFRKHLGRLPFDAEEMMGVSDHPEVVDNITSIESMVRRKNDSSLILSDHHSERTWDDLLYYEPTMHHTFEVDQVRNSLKMKLR